MSDDSLQAKFKDILQPELESLGFSKVELKNCMHPEYLFRNGRVWFSFCWDYRDRYLDVSLGRLHWFSDVMERFVVIGDYSNCDERITHCAVDDLGSLDAVLGAIASSIAQSCSRFEEKYDSVFQDFRSSRGRRKGINIDEFIGPEASEEDIRRFTA